MLSHMTSRICQAIQTVFLDESIVNFISNDAKQIFLLPVTGDYDLIIGFNGDSKL